MARAVRFVVPGDPETITGGYIYDKRMAAALRERGWRLTVDSLPGAYPFPDGPALAAARAYFAGLPDGTTVVVDGLALGALPAVVRPHAARLRLVALVHHPLACESGLTEAENAHLFKSERAALALVRRVIASSPVAVRELGRYDVPADTIGHALPGVDPGPLATGSGGAGPVALLCVAILVPRKGHTVLLEALAGLVRLDWCLACVGGHDLHPAHAEAVRALTSRLGLDDRVAFMGAVAPEAMEPHYGRADVLVHPALYEGYGMVLTEAVARGLPIVGTTGGAIPEVVPAEAAILVPPGDVAALGEALARIIADADLRARLAAGARAARARLAGWRETADRFEAELERAIAA